MSDEGGAIWSSLKEVFGDLFLHRVVSCKAHFKFSVDRKSLELPNNIRAEFKLLCNDMIEGATQLMYAKARRNLENFCQQNDVSLSTWMKWWDDRKGHIFTVFKSLHNAPNANLAEAGHS